MELNFSGKNIEDIIGQVKGFLKSVECEPDTLASVPQDEPIKPVLTQEQMAENVAKAPEHKEPPQPTLEEVRAALKDLRDKKGSGAVKDLLRVFDAESVPALKPEHYLAALETALGGGVR